MYMFWQNQKVTFEGQEWDGHEPNERKMHVLNMVDPSAGPERHRLAKGIYEPLFLKPPELDE